MNLVKYTNNMKINFYDGHENILTQNSYKDFNQYHVILISTSSFGYYLNEHDTKYFQFPS